MKTTTFSIEFINNFAGTDKPYLVGLAATNSPACNNIDYFNNQYSTIQDESINSYNTNIAIPNNIISNDITDKDINSMTQEIIKTTNQHIDKLTTLTEEQSASIEELKTSHNNIAKTLNNFENLVDKLTEIIDEKLTASENKIIEALEKRPTVTSNNINSTNNEVIM